MERLRLQHRGVIIAIFGAAAALSILVAGIEPLPNQWWDYVLRASPAAGAATILFLYEWIGWRVLNPRLDLSGRWVFYEKQYIVDPKNGERVFDYEAWGTIRVVQSVRRIAVVQGLTRKETIPSAPPVPLKFGYTSAWSSRACDLNDDGDTVYLCLDHDSSVLREGGELRYAVEVIKVGDDVDWRGAPQRMSSVVYHCVGSGTPRVVDCHYERGRIEDYWARRDSSAQAE